MVFRQWIRNQGALIGTSSAKKHVSFSCTPPSARVLNKCPGCPCAKPMPQMEKLRLGEVGPQSCDGAKPGLNPYSLYGSEPRTMFPVSFPVEPVPGGAKAPPGIAGPIRVQEYLISISYPHKVLPGPVEHSAHTNDSISPEPQRQGLCHSISLFQTYGGSQQGRHTTWNPSIFRGPMHALTELTGWGPQGIESSGAWGLN